MTAKVKIVVEAQDKASGKLGAIGSAFGRIQERIVSILSANLLENLGRQMIQFSKEAIDSTVKYANSVRNLQLASGQTAEEASRMIQVFDDFKINVDNLSMAFRKMTSEGLTPNIETIAQLADEYVALQSPLEKNKLLMDKFGRSGLEMAEMMSKGGGAIREMGAAVDESLILTQEGVDAAREYEIALDSWNDAVQGLKVSIGTGLLPVLSDTINWINASTEADKRLREEGLQPGTQAYYDRRNAIMNEIKAEQQLQNELMLTAGAAGEVTEAIGDIKDFGGDVTFVLGFQAKTNDFESEKDKILGQMEEIKDEIIAMQESWRRSDKQKIPGLQEDLMALTGELNKNEAEFKQWQKQAVFSLIQTKLAADGLSDMEFEQLMAIGEELGVLDPEVVDQATAMMDSITAVDPGNLEEAAKHLKYIIDQDGRVVTIYVNELSSTAGETVGGGGAALGASFDVPYGYPHDSYMLGLSSGEHVDVTTAADKGATGGGNTVHNHYYYGPKITLERGFENEILARLTE